MSHSEFSKDFEGGWKKIISREQLPLLLSGKKGISKPSSARVHTGSGTTHCIGSWMVKVNLNSKQKNPKIKPEIQVNR